MIQIKKSKYDNYCTCCRKPFDDSMEVSFSHKDYNDSVNITLCGKCRRELMEALSKAETNCPEIPDSSDAISRQDAIEAINLWLYCDKDERMPADVIKALPSVQTEIIHCKDCLYKKICSWKNQGAKFCSFGERGKKDGQE